MSRAVKFLIVLVAGLAILAFVADFVLIGVTRGWFERDLQLRARLAAASARQSLAAHWTGDRVQLAEVLDDMSREERVMGSAAVSMEGEVLAATEGFPKQFTTPTIVNQARAGLAVAPMWSMSADLPAGQAHLSATILDTPKGPLGILLLAHDMSFVGRREMTTRTLLLAAFFVLALGGSAVTLLAAKLAWRKWILEFRRALSGEPTREFQPLVRDVRALVDRLARERETEARAGRWSPERLRSVLTQYLQGEKIVVLSNREPYVHEKSIGGPKVVHPASGLVTALEPIMRACSGVWVAHGSGSADRDTVDANSHLSVPPGEESYVLRRVWLSEEEENGYYYGFSNEGLWPLCHLADARPTFRTGDWDTYVAVNRKFAEAVCEEADTKDPVILVQDYHFALAPKMIRERLPQATILTFWHIPWPTSERLGICPWRAEILSGLLGSSIVGFHTQQHCNNFIDSVDAFMESRIDRESNAVYQASQKTLVRPYPISVEWPVRWLEKMPPMSECRASVFRELGLRDDALLGVGVDRLDYTKGIEERILAVDELLEQHPEYRGRFSFALLAAPSRTKIARYRDLNARVEELAAQVNKRWGNGSYKPIHLLRAHHEPPTVFRYYRAADLCYVSSLHDGMNLVAKEFVAAREDEHGVLILSEFTGAARDLTEALIVNPYDLRKASDALAAALSMPDDEQRERMKSMRKLVSEFNVYRWAGRMLIDAAELRRRERMSGRIPIEIEAEQLGGA
jgi:trehalose 6-phosphate synthase